MWWLPLVTAAKGAMDAKAGQERQQRYNKGQAEVTRYSPLTGQTGQLDNSPTPSMLSGGIAGGVQGLGIQQALQNGMSQGSDWASQGTASAGGDAPQKVFDWNAVAGQKTPTYFG